MKKRKNRKEPLESEEALTPSAQNIEVDKSLFERETHLDYNDIGFTPDLDGLNYKTDGIPEESFEDLHFESEKERVRVKTVNKVVHEHGGSVRAIIISTIYIVLALIVGIFGGIVVVKVANDVFAFSYEKDDDGNPIMYTYEITEDNLSVSEVSQILKKAGVINYPFVFKIYAQLKKVQIFTTDAENDNKDRNMVLGTHTVSSAANYDAILHSLNPARPREEVDITFTDAMTTDDIIDLLVEKGVGTREGFIDVIQNYPFDYWFVSQLDEANLSEDRFYRLDGYLYPDTYRFFTDSSEVVAINKFLANFDRHFTQEIKDACKASGRTVDEIVIIASMIQGETKHISDFVKVSAVFYNRLKSKDFEGRLDSDATVQYYFRHSEGARHKQVTPEDLKVDTPYNTYLYKGLTPGAICNPSINAVKAALYPAENFPYYYFVSRYNGYMYYAKTYKEHQENIEKAKKEQQEYQEAGWEE